MCFGQGSEGYVAFTKELRKLDCESLVLQSTWNCHNSVSSMLHLLRICNGLKKLVVNLRCFEVKFNFFCEKIYAVPFELCFLYINV